MKSTGSGSIRFRSTQTTWRPSDARVRELLPGWDEEITEVRSREDLPAAAQRYVDRISQLLERPVDVISVGPDREQTMFPPGGVAAVAHGA